jgi:hypothetical protein
LLAVSEPVEPGEKAIVFLLLPDDVVPYAVWLDPPTAAAFGEKPERIDLLTAGETLDVAGVPRPSLRMVVRNMSRTPAIFRAQVGLLPDRSKLEHALGNIVDDAWRTARDAQKEPS